MSTCDCRELEDELVRIEREVNQAENKIIYYRNSLAAQEEYTRDILDMANDVSEFFEFDDIGDLLDFILDLKDLAEKIAVGGVFLARAKLAAAYIALVLAYYVSTAAASVALEAIYQNRLNYWSNELKNRKQKYTDIKGKLEKCIDSLIKCQACAGEFVNKGECGRGCGGCERWYCTNCFDGAIEGAELAAGVAF